MVEIEPDPSRRPSVRRLFLAVDRGGLIVPLLVFGALKWGDAEAQAIQPWVSHSPFLSWLYPTFGIQGAARLMGSIEIALAVLISLRRWSPMAGLIGSVGAALTFLTTLSFLFTTPGLSAMPLSPEATFLLKDVLFLAAALASAYESALLKSKARSA